MMSLTRSTSRLLAPLALGLFLGLTAFTPDASAQAAKEPTDGFFDVPARPDDEKAEAWGMYGYVLTSFLGGGAIFVLCRSARRS